MWTITEYKAQFAGDWDAFVKTSRNGTFILRRPYMDYHAHRFRDLSLMIHDEKGKLRALFAAAVSRDSREAIVVAHPGLTYGGLILAPDTCGMAVLEILQAVVEHYSSLGFKGLRYHAIPYIFHRQPSQEDIYALWHMGAVMERCLLSSTYDSASEPVRSSNTKQSIHRALRDGVRISQDEDPEKFHTMLCHTLDSRHNARPVHSVEELRLLMSRFPENMRLWMAYDESNEILAGTLVYITDMCVHTQYIASTERGRQLRAPALMLAEVQEYYSASHRYFDFGTSNEDGGRILNPGLLRQKNGFGARGVAYQSFYLQF